MSRLTFDADRHIYRLGGSVVPSVTDVLRPLESFANVPRDALENARERGSIIHLAIALMVRNDLDWESIEDQEIAARLRGAERFLLDSGIVVIASEMQVYSERLRCAGTLDLLGNWRRREALIDFKATAAVPPSVGPQTAGYDMLRRELYGGPRCMRYCVHLLPGDYRVIPLEESRDESIFLSALNLYHWGRQHAAAA